MENLSQLIDILKAEQLDTNLFRANSIKLPLVKVYGGQVLAQALYCAAKTVDSQRIAHSLHGYFLRPGNFDRPIIYDVDPIRDGGSFTTRRVVAKQDGKAIFNCSISFQQPEQGLEHQFAEAWGSGQTIDPPAQSESEASRHLFPPEWLDLRMVSPTDQNYSENAARQMGFWFKAAASLGEDILLHQMLLALISDYGMVTAGLLPHGLRGRDKRVQGASLDHAIYFHTPFSADQWNFYSVESPRAVGGRGFNRGQFFNQDGSLLSSVSQETLMRFSGDNSQQPSTGSPS
jgi:acyl-CoA thioesterase-2